MDIEVTLLRTLNEKGEIADSGEFAASIKADHLAVVGTIKSLQSAEMIVSSVRELECIRSNSRGRGQGRAWIALRAGCRAAHKL